MKVYSMMMCFCMMLCAEMLVADVRLPKIFGDGMVLQRNQPIAVWGWADPNETVSVTFNTQTVSATAGTDGTWQLHLAPQKAGGPYELVAEGKNTIRFKDVLVGEVWVCSGQSNMEWIVKNSANPEQEIASSDYPQIRHIKIQHTITGEPPGDLEGHPTWKKAHPANTGEFTAVGYYYARELHRALGVPVGLINTSWGGTMSETWTSREAFAQSDEFKSLIADLETIPLDTLSNAKKPNDYPTLLFNGMINPLIPYTIKGAIWYQGETNASRAYQYRQAFPLMINDWRQRWGLGDFPFYYVQLSSWKVAGGNSETGSTWAELREAQTLTLSLPNTGQAITTDIGDTEDIHPKNKQDVGKRLAAIALNKTYGKKIVYSGPVYKSHKVKGNSIVLRFDHAHGGLKPGEGDQQLIGFEIAGSDQKFKSAQAVIKGKTIKLSADGVDRPVAVRYSWMDDAGKSNLFNGEGFPAGPFRTDDWPAVTRDVKYTLKK